VQRYSTLSLSDVYSAIGYYLRHQETVETYLNYREQLADSVRQRLLDIQPDMGVVRSRLLAQKNLEKISAVETASTQTKSAFAD